MSGGWHREMDVDREDGDEKGDPSDSTAGTEWTVSLKMIRLR